MWLRCYARGQVPDITGRESLTGASEARVWEGEGSMGVRVWKIRNGGVETQMDPNCVLDGDV